ncbi:MAG: hypothetical protein K2P81_14120 [Bacteriovoracaceae bacterium]|nr:hypothetical protein [Bacteriovoracaceae bacterium]
MPGRLLLALGRIFFDQAATWRLLAFSIFGYAFSLAVILSTLGLMDGFEETLKNGLRLSSGDAYLTHKNGFYQLEDSVLEEMQLHGVQAVSGLVQSEAFALREGMSKGVLVRGIDPKDFGNVTGLKIPLQEQSIVLGDVLARDWKMNLGDEVTLVLAKGHEGEKPQFITLKYAGSVRHGIYEKDSRFVYMNRPELQESLGLGSKINLGLIQFVKKSSENLEESVRSLDDSMGNPWYVKASWQEFSGLLEAVAVEKTSIAVVLQLIVVVAVFNVAAFLITLQSRKTREFFLLRAFGLPRKRFFVFASTLLLNVWLTSCVVALGLVKFFNYLLIHASWLQVPGDIYVLTQLQVKLELTDYLIVFGLALVWMIILGGFAIRKVKGQSLLTGLRQEFQ